MRSFGGRPLSSTTHLIQSVANFQVTRLNAVDARMCRQARTWKNRYNCARNCGVPKRMTGDDAKYSQSQDLYFHGLLELRRQKNRSFTEIRRVSGPVFRATKRNVDRSERRPGGWEEVVS
jgi:hypothetical protein